MSALDDLPVCDVSRERADDSAPNTAPRARYSARRSVHAAPETRDILCADQVAMWLGVDRKTVYNAAARGKLPCQRLGKRLLFSRQAIGAWIGGIAPTTEGAPP